jgi:hypothetical protein
MARTDEDNRRLVDAYLAYLEHVRVPSWPPPAENPHDEAWEQFDELITSHPRVAWTLLLEVVQRCAEDDLPMVGAGILEPLLAHDPALAGEYESQIRTNDRFLKAFQYAAMTGVPLEAQRQVNAAMAARGVDAKFLVEYDETIEED